MDFSEIYKYYFLFYFILSFLNYNVSLSDSLNLTCRRNIRASHPQYLHRSEYESKPLGETSYFYVQSAYERLRAAINEQISLLVHHTVPCRQLCFQWPPALQQRAAANTCYHVSNQHQHQHVLNCRTHLETEADGRDDAEHGGPGADPEGGGTRVIFRVSQMPPEEELDYY